MEADTDDKQNCKKPKDPVNTTASSKAVTISQSVAVSPRDMDLPLSSSQYSLCSTPSMDEMENNFLKQQQTLHTYDSGFSDWTPDSVASLSETPNLQSVSFSAQIESKSDSSMKTHRLSLQSPDTDDNTMPFSPMLHLQLSEDALNNANNSNSASFHSEEEVRLILSKSNMAKHSPVGQFLERSRSVSRSHLSSVSDDLEGRFQKMSLEESSLLSNSNSSSNQPSPTPLTSSSPVFSFSLRHKTSHSVSVKSERKLSHLPLEYAHAQSDFVTPDDFSGGANSNDLIPSSSSQNARLPNDLPSISHGGSLCPHYNATDKHLGDDIHKVHFVSNLSLIPVVEPYKHSSQHSSSSKALFRQDEPIPSTDNPSSVSLLQYPYPYALSSQCQHHCSSSHSCSTCLSSANPSISADVDNFTKSPSKRTCGISHPISTESISPQKMRKLRPRNKKSSYSCNFKKDLSSFQCAVQSNSETEPVQLPSYEKDATQQRALLRSVDERIPQFLHIGDDLGTVNDKLHKTSSTKALVTPVSRRTSSNSRNIRNIKSRGRWKQADEELVNRVCLKFSPAIPSKLIGRHVGVKKIDILGELQQRSFTECIEVILAYIPDCDLLKFVEVSSEWKSAMFAEPKAHRRYKAVCKKMSSPGKPRNQAEKENMGKHLDRENIPMTTSKGHLTTIQQQLAVTDTCTPSSIPQQSELLSEECTRNCPHCQCPAIVKPSQDRAICMSDKCAYDFCTKCFSPFHHPCPCKPLFHPASKTMLAGSKKSKKNLKRLKNL